MEIRPHPDQHRDCGELQEHQNRLRVAAAPDAEAVDDGQDEEGDRCDEPVRKAGVRVLGERDRYRRHPAALDDEQQAPSIKKGDRRVVGVAEVGVLSARFRT